jgi:hypothetical protein
MSTQRQTHALLAGPMALMWLCAGPAWAQPPPPGAPPMQVDGPARVEGGVRWSALSPQQQQLLGRFQGNWDGLPAGRQQALAFGANRWLSMSPQERADARARVQAWQSMPVPQRERIRQRWEQFQRLTPEQQRAVQQNYRAFGRLPPQERSQLRQQWLHASPAERQQMLQRQRGGRPRGFAGAGRGRR